ncbi:MAG: hypothetical protein EPO11_06725 [Gammaproteobacteria bacterium]|nr:MAG: hypothetical protein EPO11_06725 [Gammaproteobacteria bacterium]
MKKLIVILFSLFFISVAFAESFTHIPKNLSIKINLDLQRGQNNYSLENKWKIAADNHHWTVIQNNPGDQFILLSKVAQADEKKVMIDFLVLDASKTPNIIAAPQMIVLYGQKGQVTMGDNKQKIQLAIVAMAK